MKERKAVWLILGIGLAAAGVLLLDKAALLGIGLFAVGTGILILLSVSVMRISERVKDSYFDRGQKPSEKFVPVSVEAGKNVWDQLTENKEETR